jgi:hypothetical protein
MACFMIAFMQAQFSLELARFTHHLSHDIEFHGKLLASQNRGIDGIQRIHPPNSGFLYLFF